MTLKRRIFVFIINFFQFLFERKKLKNTVHFNININRAPDNHLDIISIAFNNIQVVKHQIRLIQKNIIDDNYSHIIVDNSSDLRKREIIKSLCKKEGIAYVSLPKQYFNRIIRKPSYSHGAAMNWTYNNLIRIRKPAYFAFIDHDLFPVEKYSIKENLNNQDFFGTKIDRSNFWYLWAGFCFFNYSKIRGNKLNFFPCIIDNEYLDTGGSNYLSLYKNYDEKTLHFAVPKTEQKIREGDVMHADFIHVYDTAWIHTINGSYWKKVKSKDDIIEEILRSY